MQCKHTATRARGQELYQIGGGFLRDARCLGSSAGLFYAGRIPAATAAEYSGCASTAICRFARFVEPEEPGHSWQWYYARSCAEYAAAFIIGTIFADFVF